MWSRRIWPAKTVCALSANVLAQREEKNAFRKVKWSDCADGTFHANVMWLCQKRENKFYIFMRLRLSRDADLPTQCGVPTANRAVSVALDTRQQSRGKQIHTHTHTNFNINVEANEQSRKNADVNTKRGSSEASSYINAGDHISSSISLADEFLN